MKKILIVLLVFFCFLFASWAEDEWPLAVEGGIPLLFPLGDFAEFSQFSGGLGAQVLFSPAIHKDLEGLGFFGNVQLLSNSTVLEGTSLTSLGLSIGAEYKLSPPGPEALSFSFLAGLGLFSHFSDGIWNATSTGPQAFLDTFAPIAVGIHWSFGDIGEIILRGRYHVFLESGNTGQLLGTELAYRYSL
ncbi:MAG: hypothetical protein JEY99_04415 [Spirochaetales bacterium]|nr:hypothetical protein [Spirochaetales bacterium]